ncbi:hypothetical protein FI667_g15457, partial [Globisporangium splendens]
MDDSEGITIQFASSKIWMKMPNGRRLATRAKRRDMRLMNRGVPLALTHREKEREHSRTFTIMAATTEEKTKAYGAAPFLAWMRNGACPSRSLWLPHDTSARTHLQQAMLKDWDTYA